MADKEKPTPWRRLSDACMEKESVFLHRGDAVRHPGSAFGLLLVAGVGIQALAAKRSARTMRAKSAQVDHSNAVPQAVEG